MGAALLTMAGLQGMFVTSVTFMAGGHALRA